MNRIKKILTSICILIIAAAPNIAFAWGGVSSYCTQPGGGCSLCDGIRMVKAALDWINAVSISLGMLSILIGGIMYVFAGANPGLVGKAKGIFKATAIGLGFIFGAWLIVNIILVGTGAVQTSTTSKIMNPSGWFVVVCD